MRVGIIGAGWPGQQHARAIRALKSVTLQALAEPNEERTREFAKSYRPRKSYPDYSDFRQRAKTIALAGREQQALNLTGNDGVERVWGEIVTDNYFDVLGVRPVLGRGFVEADMKDGAPLVAVLGYGLWQRKFGGDPEIVGRTVPINGRPFAVVGPARNATAVSLLSSGFSCAS